jgi:hypothetical protein
MHVFYENRGTWNYSVYFVVSYDMHMAFKTDNSKPGTDGSHL